jgi:hypothetical protein
MKTYSVAIFESITELNTNMKSFFSQNYDSNTKV